MSKKYFCAAPFTRMVQSPNGELRTCVYHPPLKKKYNSISDAFLSEEMNVIRNEMIKDQRRPECEWCYYYDDSNQFSCRQDINERYDDSFFENPITKLIELDFSASNKCNFTCVTCNEDSSSSWRIRNSKKPFQDKKYEYNDYRNLDDINFSDLKSLCIMGGEPTIDPFFNDDFFQKLIDKTSKDLWYQMVTNCSSFPHKKWIDFLSTLNKICIGISLDGVGEVGEFCRFGFKQKIWEKNFNKWLEFFSDKPYTDERYHGPWINVVISNFNIFAITDIFIFLEKYNMRHRVMLTVAFGPEYLSPTILPDSIKENIYKSEFYDKNHEEFIFNLLHNSEFDIRKYKKFLRYSNYLKQFKEIPEKCLLSVCPRLSK